MKIKGLRWYIILLIGLATVINYIDRSAINIMWPYIYHEFGIAEVDSKSTLALITTFFMIAYALGQTFTGKLMDSIGTRLGMAISIAGWSISIALHALARTLFSFNIFRFFLGFFEAGNWPGATKSNAEWFPAKERAIAQGIFGAGASLGSVISAPIIALLFIAFGWKATFFLIGAFGILWVIPWLYINKANPDKHPWITDEEKEHILSCEVAAPDAALNAPVLTWTELLKFKSTWGIILGRFFIDPVWWLFVTWLPTFLKEQFLFDIKQIGAFTWVPYLFAAVGSLSGGFYSSRLIKNGMEPEKARKSAITIGCVLMLTALLAILFYLSSLKDHPMLAMCLIGVTLFGFQFLIGNLQTLPSDYYNGKNVGTVAGMGGTAAVVGTLFTTWAVPVITQTSYVSFFVLAAVLVPVTWLSVKFMSSKKIN
ncbi:ACS family hexuronate transporter-like MFS transporter [Arcticibacter tournemirensis]|uniref:MFS transporter n=1 Tax=Arcticibacter tournemirensis TaxID=699437 RepID=A0A4Q0MDM4_9SPHI|nr:MFS transporter [Arcticibacter tournemirensis]KAA8482226.1 MFS transporter [Arcticibacter tournemirensis]RXF71335.1 MFS transporter [Arcticibacter tournemirensis]TQM52365.1 ACS family hexuronate transporter-like MFS transporter [Arcticibacter tournemirensis]